MPSDALTRAAARGSARAAEAAPAQVEKHGYDGILSQLSDPKQQQAIAAALPHGVDPQRFNRVVITAFKSNPALIELGGTPEGRLSLVQAVMRCAALGLEPNTDLGHAYLIAFRSQRQGLQLQVIIGYKGYLQLAADSGHLRSIDVREVYANDEFSVVYGTGDDAGITHKPTWGLVEDGPDKGKSKERGPIVGYYGIVKFLDGGYYFTHATLGDILARKERSGAVKAGAKTPWDSDPVAMSKKTVVRMMAPFMRMSVKAAEAAEMDEQSIAADGSIDYIDVDSVEEATPAGDEPVEATGSEAEPTADEQGNPA